MTEHDLRSEADRFWPSSVEQAAINAHRKPLDLAAIKRWDNAFWGVAIPVGAAAIILAGIMVGS